MTPDIYTLSEKMIDVGDGHQLYSQLWGNNDAEQTIIYLHGGPGGGTSDSKKDYFNPKKHRIIFFDQRGAGKSLPYGSLEANTTTELIEDINKVADEHDAKTFTLWGSSWGSCLALLYAIKYPARVSRMVLNGIFTARQSEIDFIAGGSVKPFFPDAWEKFLRTVPKDNRTNPQSYHEDRILGKDKDAALQSAIALTDFLSALVKLDDRRNPIDPATFDSVPITIETHYMKNKYFIPENYIVDNTSKLTMPIDLVQGRYDAMCPPTTAYEIHNKLPNSQLYWTLAGHSGSDRSNTDVIRALLASIC